MREIGTKFPRLANVGRWPRDFEGSNDFHGLGGEGTGSKRAVPSGGMQAAVELRGRRLVVLAALRGRHGRLERQRHLAGKVERLSSSRFAPPVWCSWSA